MTSKNNNGWTEDHRKKQAENCRQTKPWEKSTGPQTKQGKQAIRENALKHGFHSKEGLELRKLMYHHRLLVNSIIRQDGEF